MDVLQTLAFTFNDMANHKIHNKNLQRKNLGILLVIYQSFYHQTFQLLNCPNDFHAAHIFFEGAATKLN